MYSRTSAKRTLAQQFIATLILGLILMALVGPILLPFALLPDNDPTGLGNGVFLVSLQRQSDELWRSSHEILSNPWQRIQTHFAVNQQMGQQFAADMIDRVLETLGINRLIF